MILIILIFFFILGVCIVFVFIRMKRHAQRINDYFCNAVRVYYLLGDEETKIAALAAAKVAAGRQRGVLLYYLEGLISDFSKSLPEMPEMHEVINRLSKLKEEIAAKDWTMKDIIQEKQKLQKLNPSYLKALEKGDSNIFVRNFSNLFTDNV